MGETEEIADPDFFELMVTRFTPSPQSEECRIRTVQELDLQLAPFLEESMLAIGLSCVAEGAGWGYFLLLVNGARAWVHLMEGRCVTAHDTNLGVKATPLVRFQDDAGVWHEVPFQDTITREQGIRALQHWVPHGEKMPELTWVQS